MATKHYRDCEIIKKPEEEFEFFLRVDEERKGNVSCCYFVLVSERASSFFNARFSVMVVGAAARDLAATLHSLPLHPSFCLGKFPSDSI